MDAPSFVPMLLKVHKNPAFDVLQPAIFAVLGAGLLRPDAETARACYAAFCAVPFTHRDIPIAELSAAAGEGRFQLETVEVFARLPQLPVSTRLLAALLAVGTKTPLTANCLCRLALSLNGAQAVLAMPKWMDREILALHDAVLLLLVVCRFADTRDALADAPEFPDFVMRVVKEAGVRELGAVVVVLRKMRASPEFVRALDEKGFFECFMPKALEGDNPQLKDAAFMLVAAFAKIAWVSGFVHWMCYLPSMIERGGRLAGKALAVALMLAVHPQARAPLAYLNLGTMITNCKVDPASEVYKEKILMSLNL
jgi:hypothetical protein